jgi:hypothetical protein
MKRLKGFEHTYDERGISVFTDIWEEVDDPAPEEPPVPEAAKPPVTPVLESAVHEKKHRKRVFGL